MPTIEEAFTNAVLADAAYVGNLRFIVSAGQLTQALSTTMTPALAGYVSKRFSVVTQIESELSGFDATLWRANNPDGSGNSNGKLYLSMRGTQQAVDFLVDADLAVTGNARVQVVEMINWWLRISTPRGEPANQVAVLGPAYMPSLSVPGEGLVSASDVAAGIEVNGHSLGGYLATAFTRLFGVQANVKHVSTFNSAGFAPGSEIAFAMLQAVVGSGYGLGRFPSQTEQTNYFAKSGLNVTTNSFWFSQQGRRTDLFNESSLNQLGNHSMYKLADSLALGYALSKLDAGLTIGKVNLLLEAGSNKTQGSLEGVLDGLRSMLQGSVSPTPVGDVSDSGDSRKVYHSTLAALQETDGFRSLEGMVTLMASGANIGIRAQTRVGFEEMAALEILSPVVLSPTGAEGKAALQFLWNTPAWIDRYQDWLADQASLANGQSAGNFTDQWVDDRAAMLQAVLERNRRDIEGILPGTSNLAYTDAASGTQVLVGAGSAQRTHYAFGADGTDILEGQGFGDRLYGGAGEDFIDGKGGNDYIEGNTGDDDLYGGDGADTLLGGSGDDSLSGEAQNDVLLGGTGDDTYRFDDAFGNDKVTDADDVGKILIDGNPAVGGKTSGRRNVWQAKDSTGGVLTYTVGDDTSSFTGKRLVIARDADTANTVTVKNFSLAAALSGAGYMGIKLETTQRLILKEGGGPNVWTDPDFDAASLEGESSDIAEGGGKGYTVHLASAAKAGDTLTLSISGDGADTINILLDGSAVAAQGARITLVEGQTEVALPLVQDGDLDADASCTISASYSGESGSAVSNAWAITLKDDGELGETINGDFIVRTETNVGDPFTRGGQGGLTVTIVDTDELYFVKDGATNNLVEGTEDPTIEPIYNDAGEVVGFTEIPSDDLQVTNNALFGTALNDKIDGKTGNDLIAGNAGNDQIDGGIGNDMIGGGAGNDRIDGGDGDDFISSSADIEADRQQAGPNDTWDRWGQPAGAEIKGSGATWGVYPDSSDATTAFWSAMSQTRTDAQSDAIDAGAGDDWVMASWGDDRVEGGAGNDRLEGLAGDDVLEGGDGNDNLDGDGILKVGYINSVAADRHGSDFIDGGLGDDKINGGGGSDNIFGGAGKDTIFADGSGASDSESFVELQFQGEDYIDGEDGDDYAEGGGKDDMLYGGSGKDVLWGDAPGQNLKGATATDPAAWGNDYLDGEGGDDLLYGGGADDTLYGGVGDDQLLGDDGPGLEASMHGNDYLDGEDGKDALVGGGKDDILYGGDGDDTLAGDASSLAGEMHGADYLDGEDGNDLLIGHGGADELYGGNGDDELQGDGDSVADEYHAADFLDGGEGNDTLFGNGGDDRLTGGSGIDELFGGDGDDFLAGGEGNDVLAGGSGNDTLQGGDADDSLYGEAGDDQIEGGEGNDDLNSGDGYDVLNGGAGDDRYGIFGTQGTKVLIDLGGTETLELGWLLDDTELGSGSLLLRNTATGQEVHIEGFDADDGSSVSPIELFVFSGADDSSVVLSATQMIEQLGFAAHGTEGNDQLVGTAFNDIMEGGSGDDVLDGNDGDDRLVGGLGADFLLGGRGDDVYVVDAQGEDEILESGGEGDDTILASVDYTLSAENIEHLVLTGTDSINATGDDLANHLVGNGAANVLDGGAAADSMEGGRGDDTYHVDDVSDSVVEQLEQGQDTIVSSVSYALPDHVEDLVLVGGATAGTGNGGNNLLRGDDADNVLRGMAGTDRIEGGLGSDVYLVRDDTGIKTIADDGGDADVLDLGWNSGAMHFVLGSAPDKLGVYNPSTGQLVEIEGFEPLAEDPVSSIEDVILTVHVFGFVYEEAFAIDELFAERGLSFFGTNDPDTLAGTWRKDSLYGFAGNDTLLGAGGDDWFYGGAGDNWMAGGAGDDTYIVTESGDTIVEHEGEGFDTVRAEADFSIQGTDVEAMQMRGDGHHVGIGNDLRNYIYTPLLGSSTLFGEGGNDDLIGHRGDDSLHGGSQDDFLFAAEGNDLLAGDEGDDELVAGAGDDMLVGGDGADRLFGESGDDWLDGSAGDDILFGADGDDLLESGEGDDILAGGEGGDLLLGGDGNDELLNSLGADLLEGGNGDDIYREDTVRGLIFGFAASGTEIYEEADAGTDTVIVFESFTLGDNFENLTLRHRPGDAVLVGVGNELDNHIESTGVGAGVELFGLAGNDVLVGGAGTNWLDGGTGADLMMGGTGSTDFFVDDADDSVVALAEGLHDTVHSTLDYALGAHVENLVLEEGSATTGTGNDLANRITGNSNDNVLDGGVGSDVIQGGGGNDILIGTQGLDGLEGEDGDDLLLGSDEGTFMAGGAGRDELVGGAAADYLDGGTGADVMTGGEGDDTYVVDDVQDVIVEAEGAGRDLVVSYIDYTLEDEFEGLSMLGWGLAGIGNASDNVITGRDGAESLFGLDGDDTLDAGTGLGAMLDGGAGSDTLISRRGEVMLAGGEGDDLYRLSGSYDTLVEMAGEGYDQVLLSSAPYESVFLDLSEHVEALDASLSEGDLWIYAQGDDNSILGGSGNDEIDGGAGNDVIFGGEARSVNIEEGWPGGAARSIQDLISDGPRASLTLSQLLADFPYDVSLDSESLDSGFHAYPILKLAASPDEAPESMTLYVSPWLTDEPESSQTLVIQPDGTLLWEGGGYFQESILAGWNPRSGRLTWEQLAAQYGVRSAVENGEREAFIAVTAYGIPVPGQPADSNEGQYAPGTIYWPRDRLPADTQALLNEQLHLTEEDDSLAEAFGRSGADTLIGGEGDDTLDGADGNDMLFGGDGADILVGGADKTLSLRVEYWSESGATLLDIGTVISANNDVLDGGAGLDTLIGGTGDDTYYVDGEATPNPDGHVAMFDWCDVDHRFGMDAAPLDNWVTDTVVEAQGEGNDKVIASASVVLANVETVELSEDAPNLDIDAVTDAGSQTLLGNSGRNTLDGGAGADFMAAGAGDDTYVVDDAGDVVQELGDAGEDIARATLDQYVLGENLEALVLDGDENLSAAGNAGANILIGNAGANVLDGGAGDDMLAGWRGDDLLRGGEGYDFYFFSRGDGHDAVEDNLGAALHFSGDIRYEELSFRTEANDLLISVGATDVADGVQVTLRDWINGGDGRVSEITFCAEQEGAWLDDSVLFNPRADLITVSEDSDGATGNLLDNDVDSFLRDRLVVDYAGEVQGQFGTLRFDLDGSFEYQLDGSSLQLQSLAEGQVVTDILWGYGSIDVVTDRWLGMADVQVDIVGANDAPVAQADGAQAVEDGDVSVAGNLLANDSDIDQGDSLSLGNPGLQAGSFGTLELASSGEFTYSLDNQSHAVQSLGEGHQAIEQFDYVTVDSHGAESVGTLELTVTGANDAPLAALDAVECVEDGPEVAGNLLANDSDVDVEDVLTVSSPGQINGLYGTLQLAAEGGFSYALDSGSAAVQSLAAGQRVVENFSYTVSDNHGATDSSNLSIGIVGANDGPIAHADAASVTEDGELSATGSVLANDADPDTGDTLTVTNAGNQTGQYGTLALASDGAYTYSLANSSPAVQALSAGEKVSEVFAYTIADTHGATASAELTVEVNGASDSCGATLIGSDRDDRLVGTECADVIDGAKGSDLMLGGKGDDTYFVDTSSEACSDEHDRDDDDRHGDDDDDDDDRDQGRGDDDGDCADRCIPGDSVIELAGGGIDMVAASVNYVLPRDVENLMLLGSDTRVASGNSLANVMVASAGASTLSGGAGHDVLVGRSAADTLYGGTGEDKLYGEGGNDKVYGGEGGDSVWGGSGKDMLDAGRGDNLIAAGAGDDTISSATGSDVIVAGAGNDRITAGNGNDFVDAGAGNDSIDTGSGSDFIAAGRGNDSVASGAGRDVVAFNRGDGQDTLFATSGSNRSSGDVLSLGGGIRYADLTLRKTGQDLVLALGAGDQITSKNWYAGHDGRSIASLQIVTVGGDFDAASANKLLGNQVVAFDFTTITQQYDAARKANSSLGAWALQPSLNSAFIGASNTSALGGDLAFDYATHYGATQGYGADMTVDAVRQEVQEQSDNNWQAASAAPTGSPDSTLVDPWVALQAGTDLVVSSEAGASNPITPSGDPATDSLMFAALAAGSGSQPSWAVR